MKRIDAIRRFCSFVHQPSSRSRGLRSWGPEILGSPSAGGQRSASLQGPIPPTSIPEGVRIRGRRLNIRSASAWRSWREAVVMIPAVTDVKERDK
ncbi:unnamed protein product [Boreogadus saida]